MCYVAISSSPGIMKTISVVLIFGMLFSVIARSKADEIFNVLDYGAIADGITDNSNAFLNAWIAACSSTCDNPTVYVPQGSQFLVNPVVFSGPCWPNNITFTVSGEIMAPELPSAWIGLKQGVWVEFSGVNGLKLNGLGSINGRGRGWWDQSCRDHPTLKGCTSLAPTAVRFISCNHLSLNDVHFLDSPQAHILLMECNTVRVYNLRITAPETSPNTDGIHMQSCTNVNIGNANIATGDDCVSIGDYIHGVTITNVTCGPGHGISVGSLGRDPARPVSVSDIFVSSVNLTGTTNGARIKTWQVGRGHVQNVIFENIIFNSVENPVIIDQYYCDVRNRCQEQKTGVEISNVIYKDLFGTSSTKVAINLSCSRSVACTGIVLDNVHLSSPNPGEAVSANCVNAHGLVLGDAQPSLIDCLQIN